MSEAQARRSSPQKSESRGSSPGAFSADEIRSIRDGSNGVKGVFPARFYYDEALHQFEIEHVLKEQWLYVGPWDWAGKPGDYFTTNMLGEPLVIVMDRNRKVHALVNACRHRFSQVVAEGSGNKSVLMCPYHRWTYNLDGTLRAISVETIAEVAPKDCALHSVRAEVWNGLIFVNFDQRATPLSEQLAQLEPILQSFNLGAYRSAGRTTYETCWNYKFSFETGYEAYHHAGVHNERIGEFMPPDSHRPLAFGKNWGVYAYTSPPVAAAEDIRYPFGRPPWMSNERYQDLSLDAVFCGIYPSFIAFIQPHQISTISTQIGSVDRGGASTTISIADWAWDRPNAERLIAEQVQFMKDVQDEDTLACTALQKGVRSSFNNRGILHPKFEPMMSHYYNWLLDQYLSASG